MSGFVVGWAFRRDGLTPVEKLVLVALADNATDDGYCWPSPGNLAMKTDLGKSTVYRTLARLDELGLVKKCVVEGHKGFLLSISEREEFAGSSPTEKPEKSRSESPIYREPSSVEPSSTTAVANSGQETDNPQTKPGDGPPPAPPSKGASGRGGKKQTTLDVGEDAGVEEVWDHYCVEFEPARPALTPSRVRSIRKGFKEGFTTEDLKLAVTGLRKWREQHKGDTSISSIFKTYPGGQSLADRISFFIEVAESSGGGGSFPSADPAIVEQRKTEVRRGHRSEDEGTVETATEAENWLSEHGIETVREEDGYPTFRRIVR